MSEEQRLFSKLRSIYGISSWKEGSLGRIRKSMGSEKLQKSKILFFFSFYPFQIKFFLNWLQSQNQEIVYPMK